MFYGDDLFDDGVGDYGDSTGGWTAEGSNTIANDVTSRFLNKAFNTHDHYSDQIVDNIVNRQKKEKANESWRTNKFRNSLLTPSFYQGSITHQVFVVFLSKFKVKLFILIFSSRLSIFKMASFNFNSPKKILLSKSLPRSSLFLRKKLLFTNLPL